MWSSAFADLEAEADDIARFARMSPEERLSLFVQLCDLTDSIEAVRLDRSALRAPTPMSDEAAALWARLMRRRNG